MQNTPLTKYAAANNFIHKVMGALSRLCRLAARENQREELASLLRKAKMIHETPAAVLAADKFLEHIETYSERILERNEEFLMTVDVVKECAAAGVQLDSTDDYLVLLFNSFRDNYTTGNAAAKDELYSHILEVHNAAMLFGQSKWI
jgi:hypothetical protein